MHAGVEMQRSRTKAERGKIRKTGEIVGRKQESFGSANHRRLIDRLNTSLADETHPLRTEFDSPPIDRSGRLRVLCARKSRYGNSFIPSAVQTLNQSVKRE